MENQVLSQLQLGNVVTVPTETVFGYAVSLHSRTGIEKLMKLKSRDFHSSKIFTLVPESIATISHYAVISDFASHLISQHFPGELTLILPKRQNFRHFYYDHFSTIGIRIPNHPLFTSLLPQVGPLLLTSANSKGGKPKTATGHLPSTIIDCTSLKPQILRQGNLIIQL